MANRKTWIWIALGVAGFLVLAFLAVAGLGAIVVLRHMQVSQATPARATVEFDQVRGRFRGQRALIELKDRRRMDDTELERRKASAAGEPATVLHVLAWNSREEKLVRLTIPMWLVKWSSRGSYRLDLGGDVSIEDMHLDAEGLEQAGPALVLDHEESDAHVLLWTE